MSDLSRSLRLRSVVFAVALAVLSACSSGPAPESASGFDPEVVWDFRTPLDATDLGSSSPGSWSVEGHSVRIILPSGIEVLAPDGASTLRSPVNPPGPLNSVSYSALDGGDSADLREAVGQLASEWGTFVDTTSNDDSTLDEIAAIATADVEAALGNGSNTQRGLPLQNFERVVDDSTSVGVTVTVDRDDRYLVFVTIAFEPAIVADA